MGLPILGICYGMQLACFYLGGSVERVHVREYGRATNTIISDNGLFEGVKKQSQVWMSHGDQVQSIAGDFVALAANRYLPDRSGQTSNDAHLRFAISSRGYSFRRRPKGSAQFRAEHLRVQ